MAKLSSGESAEERDHKQAFVPQDDRPEVKLTLDTPLSELRVRDLRAILGRAASKSQFEAGKTALDEFFGKADFEVIKMPEGPPKGADNPKGPKGEKNEKAEYDFTGKQWRDKSFKDWREVSPEPTLPTETLTPDPGMAQVIGALTDLTEQVSQLANQVEELRRKSPGTS